MTQPTENNMPADKLEIEDTEFGGTKQSGYYCTTGQIAFLLIVSAGLIAGVGCMCFYLPDRSCVQSATAEPRPGEPTASEPPQPNTDPPKSEAPATEPHQPSTAGPTPTEEEWNGRLPRDLLPENYQLYLKPYLYEDDLGDNDRLFTFDGRVKIVMDCVAPTDVITLHINNITIRSYGLSDKTGRVYDIESVDETPQYQFIHFHVTEMLEPGTGYVLEIEYLGELWDGLAGFYRSSYTNSHGTTK